jgi:ABC-type lipopolysaccharide export system ATPase subunit
MNKPSWEEFKRLLPIDEKKYKQLISDKGLEGYTLTQMSGVVVLAKGETVIRHLNGEEKSELIPELNDLEQESNELTEEEQESNELTEEEQIKKAKKKALEELIKPAGGNRKSKKSKKSKSKKSKSRKNRRKSNRRR